MAIIKLNIIIVFRFLLIAVIAMFFVSGFAQTPTYSRIKVYAGEAQLMELVKAGFDVTEGVLKFDKFLICDFSEPEIDKIETMGLSYDILIRDVSKYYAERNIGKSANIDDYKGVGEWEVPENFEFGSMSGHATWGEAVQNLDNMASLFPNLITTKISLGQTLEGRDIWMVKISDNPNVNETEPEVLYTALHHSNEPAGLMTLLYYMWYLLENYESDPYIQTLVNNTEMYFVPIVNPDGYVFNETNYPNGGGNWRKNRRQNAGTNCLGVDPNRNYGYMWGFDNNGSSSNPCHDNYRGESAFSEPETQAIRNFIENHDIKNALNYHTYGNLLLYTWGYTEEPCDDNELYQAHSRLYTTGNHYSYGPGSQANYITNGGSDDWMYGEQNTKPKIFAYTPELGGGSDGYWCPIDRIIPIAQENMTMNTLLAAFTGEYYDVQETSQTIFNEITGELLFDVQRLGLQDGGYVSILLQALSGNITAIGDNLYYQDLELLETKSGSISFTLDKELPSGSAFTFLLTIENGDYVTYDTITKIFGSTVSLFEHDGNTMNNWTSTSWWGITSTSYVSPPGSIADSPIGYYFNNQSTSITLNEEIDLTEVAYAQLKFSAKWEIEHGWDYVQVQVSTNGGSSWEALAGKFTITGNENQAEGEPLYDGFQSEWVVEEIGLMDYIGEKVAFRFIFKSDAWVTKDGFYFDDFTVIGVDNENAGSTNQSAKPKVKLSSPVPNPAQDRVSFHFFGLKTNDPHQFNIYNITGQIVFSEWIESKNSPIKISLIDWMPGVYYCYLEGIEGRSETKKLIVR
ncbi:MAG: M14 family zinc carboxypeptidase [Bacteroidales bacterium]